MLDSILKLCYCNIAHGKGVNIEPLRELGKETEPMLFCLFSTQADNIERGFNYVRVDSHQLDFIHYTKNTLIFYNYILF